MKNNLIIILLFICNFCNAQFTLTATDVNDVRIFPSTNSQHEVHISINKTAPWNLVVSSNTKIGSLLTQGFFVTNDGGITWSGSDKMPNNQEGRADPSTAFDASGRGYIATLPNALDGYLVQFSDDKGITWSNSKRGITLTNNNGGQDKEMIVCVDEMQTSTFANNLYCTWTDFDDNGKVKINRSIDGALNFNTLKTLSTGNGQGTNVQTGPNGEVYVCWANNPPITSNTPPTNPGISIGFASSLDGGLNYLTTTAFNYNGIRTTNGGNSNFGNTRVNDFPSMAVDKSCGVNRGRIYIAYPEFEKDGQGNLTSKSIINLKYSDDKGTTWSTTKTINISNGRQNWFPWISIDDLTGIVSVIYYSFDQSTGNTTNTYVAYSQNGNSWNNVKVSDVGHITAPIAGFAGGYAGDYIGITSFNGSAYCVWMDNRTVNNQSEWQIYFSKLNFNAPILVSSQSNLAINSPNTITGNRKYQASQKIKVANLNNVTISQNSIIEMIAGNEITLNSGFVANSEFIARIDNLNPCTTPGAMSFKRANTWTSLDNIKKSDFDNVQIFEYPNPAKDYITVGAINNNYKKIQILIYDLNGKLIEIYNNADITKDQIRQVIPISSYLSGIYIVQFKLDDKLYSLKFTKN
jgi:Secretion system C-terminal sorting domain